MRPLRCSIRSHHTLFLVLAAAGLVVIRHLLQRLALVLLVLFVEAAVVEEAHHLMDTRQVLAVLVALDMLGLSGYERPRQFIYGRYR
jgi:hypothetical protein